MKIYVHAIFVVLSVLVLAKTPYALGLKPVNDGGDVYSLDTRKYMNIEYAFYRTDDGWAIELFGINPSKDRVLKKQVEGASRGELDFLITLDFTPDPGLECDGNEYDVLLTKNHEIEIGREGVLIYLPDIREWENVDFARLKVYIDDHDVNASRCNR